MRVELAPGKDPLEEKARVDEEPKIPTYREEAETLHQDLVLSWKTTNTGDSGSRP